jgi:hypothetical protein
MSEELWVVRAGEKAKYVDEFLENSYVAIDFGHFASEDLGSADAAILKARSASPAQRTYASQLIAFAYNMQIGDLVIVPRTNSKQPDYLVARIVGPYQHVPTAGASGFHRRAVEWLGRFNKTELSKQATNTLGAIQTVFRPTAVAAELRTIFTALAPLTPIGGQLKSAPVGPLTKSQVQPVGVAPAKPMYASAQLDITLDPQGRARIISGHPALVMEQTPRHIDPQKDWVGVPGMYVLTGTVLQSSSMRTGNERALTTTTIVRPWAYVGLSEDFFGRLSSHRQTKPEWRRALLVRSGGQPFGSDDIKYLEHQVHSVLQETDELALPQSTPNGNISAKPHNLVMLDACADTIVAVLRLTGTLI